MVDVFDYGIPLDRVWPRFNPPLVGVFVPPQPGGISIKPGAISYARVYRDIDEQAMCEIEGRPFDGRARSIYDEKPPEPPVTSIYDVFGTDDEELDYPSNEYESGE